ncbi:hypothetical protein CYY_003079 [Polysphondylium violaceum]|uniref:Heparan-alpha-glucosaminide N-acetyltransferase catalytic domain-containing protein n=1 Tax=Polysphondylium violaceum TaxID=133409 RepID=A0A8J4Q786_9MYCE|nr:hypothetical protein CYY_003079 [Polysphondylium violaceum]
MNIQEESTPLIKQQHVVLKVNDKDKQHSHDHKHHASSGSPPSSPKLTPTTGRRMGSLDAVRGITIFGMILVDNQGGPDVIWPLKETEWNGLSTADLIFPSFLFICGFSVALALKNSKNDIKTWANIIRRTFLLFFIQCFLNLMAHHFVFDSFRIMGVLQRIAICYFLSCMSFLCFPVFLQRLFLIATSTVYLGLMYGWNVPGCGKGQLTPSCNAGSYIDNKVFGPNMIHPNDPEGLLSTLMAFVTTWMGVEFGRIFTTYYKKYNYSQFDIIARWMILVILFIVPAIGLGATVLPFNKLIWSFSFALFTVGAGGALILVAYIVVDVVEWGPKVRKAVDISIQPFVWIGMNPITIYSFMVFIEIIFMFYLNVGSVSLWTAIYEKMYLSWLKNGYLASTVFSLGWFVFFDLIAYIMHRNKIFIKL